MCDTLLFLVTPKSHLDTPLQQHVASSTTYAKDINTLKVNFQFSCLPVQVLFIKIPFASPKISFDPVLFLL